MYKYEVGQKVDAFRGYQECVKFDISDSGAVMLVFFNNPLPSEIDQFKAGNSFEIRFTEIYGVIMMTVKIGNLNWMDAPYTPHLSKHLTTFQLPDDNHGLGLTLILVDTATGEIKHMRLLGLSEKFSKRLFGIVMEQKVSEFDTRKYDNAIDRIYSAYSTAQIVKMSRDYCRLND